VNDFESIAIIGRGAFGEVRLCRSKNGELVAVKKMKKEEMIKKNQVTIFALLKFLQGDSRAGRTRHFGESELRMDRGLEMFVSGRLPLVPGDGVLGWWRPHDAAHEKGHPDRGRGQVLSR
jgi:serine/threonine protein kinase